MTAPTPNAELAWLAHDTGKALDRLRMEQWCDGPGIYNTNAVGLAELTSGGNWCGTTACLAGWATMLSGFLINRRGDVFERKTGEMVTDGSISAIQKFAAELLGIDWATSEYLFYADDEEITEAVEAVFGPRPTAYGTGCRCDWLGENTPEHAPSALCRSLRPDADRDGEPS